MKDKTKERIEWNETIDTGLQLIGSVPDDVVSALTGLSKEEIEQIKIERMMKRLR